MEGKTDGEMADSGSARNNKHVVSVICLAVNSRPMSQKILGEVSCMECTGQRNDFELIPMAKMETRHPVEGSFGNEFPLIYNHCRVIALEVAKC